MLIANYAYSFRIEPVLMATCIEKSLLYKNHLRIKFYTPIHLFTADTCLLIDSCSWLHNMTLSSTKVQKIYAYLLAV